jgi:LDH2 family malate/lactate/ureidoglycolate dehydrogenase
MDVVSSAALHAYAREILLGAGFGPEDADACADLLTETSLAGIGTHDAFALLPLYVEYARNGVGGRDANPTVSGDAAAARIVDGGGASGPRTMRLAAAVAAERARASGIGLVSARRVGYFGAMRWSAAPLAQQGLIAIVACNAMASEPPALGLEPISGTNPIAIAIPHEPDPIVLDMRTDHLDPPARGYGLALMIDVLTAGLAHGPIGREVEWETERGGLAALVIAIDPAFGSAAKSFAGTVARLAHQVHATTPVTPGQPVRLPGERAARERRRRLRDGIPVEPDRLHRLLRELADLDVHQAFPAAPAP